MCFLILMMMMTTKMTKIELRTIPNA